MDVDVLLEMKSGTDAVLLGINLCSPLDVFQNHTQESV